MKDSDYTEYCCQYFHKGSWWSLHIFAEDWNDAEERAKKLNLQLTGQFMGSIDWNVPGAKWYVRLRVWFKNFFESES
jgi:hypothetical protein